jgi:nitrate/nitrite transport system permease protein
MEQVSLVMPGVGTRGDWRRRVRELSARVLPAAASVARSAGWSLASLAIALGVWQLVCLTISKDFPTPVASLRVTLELLGNAFTKVDGIPGIGLQVLASMQRIAIGFTLSAAVAIPAGILIGVSPTIRKLFDPIVQVLRPVSPLVWFPLALVAFKNLGGVSSSTLFTIFVTSLWPTLINTAVGVSSLPADYKIVAKVFRFSRARYLRKILLPHTLPYVLTGLRLSMGTAWLVIVAAEMLSGDMGIGFFAWDAYNAGSYEKMIAAVAAIGGVGLALDRGFSALSRRFDFHGTSR